jgi:hypothetical protein
VYAAVLSCKRCFKNTFAVYLSDIHKMEMTSSILLMLLVLGVCGLVSSCITVILISITSYSLILSGAAAETLVCVDLLIPLMVRSTVLLYLDYMLELMQSWL